MIYTEQTAYLKTQFNAPFNCTLLVIEHLYMCIKPPLWSRHRHFHHASEFHIPLEGSPSLSPMTFIYMKSHIRHCGIGFLSLGLMYISNFFYCWIKFHYLFIHLTELSVQFFYLFLTGLFSFYYWVVRANRILIRIAMNLYKYQ